MPLPHPWNLTAAEAIVLQKRLAEQARGLVPLPLRVRPGMLIAGVDVAYQKFAPILHAAVVVLRLGCPGEIEVIETQSASGPVTFPYIPGLLSFRETPGVLEAIAKLRNRPDIVMFDGQGYAHPRRFGIATHAGLLLGLPTFGCAKSLLLGEYQSLPTEAKASVPLQEKGEQVGLAVRTKRNTNPVFISVGYRIRLEDALAWTLATCQGFRIPEPTRQAHLAVNEIRRRAAQTQE